MCCRNRFEDWDTNLSKSRDLKEQRRLLAKIGLQRNDPPRAKLNLDYALGTQIFDLLELPNRRGILLDV